MSKPPTTQQPVAPNMATTGTTSTSSISTPSPGVQVSRPPGSRPGMLSVAIKDKLTLYSSYMPFLKNGGLFIPVSGDFKMDNDFQMGCEVFILLSLMDERIPVAGKVVWITPERAEGNRAPGFGVQFNDLEGVANKKIEALLAGAQEVGKPTYTM